MSGNTVDYYWDMFWSNWDGNDRQGSINEIMNVTGLKRNQVLLILYELGFMERQRVVRLRKEKYRTRKRLPSCVRYSLCPKCGKKMAIERVPFTKYYDLFCISCGRIPLPNTFKYRGNDGEDQGRR